MLQYQLSYNFSTLKYVFSDDQLHRYKIKLQRFQAPSISSSWRFSLYWCRWSLYETIKLSVTKKTSDFIPLCFQQCGSKNFCCFQIIGHKFRELLQAMEEKLNQLFCSHNYTEASCVN